MQALRTMVGLSKAPTQAMLAHSQVPALVVMGSRDPDFAQPAAEAQWLGQLLGRAPYMVEGVGHYPHLEMPESVAAAVLQFLAQLPAAQ